MRSWVIGDLVRELEATKLRVKLLEEDQSDLEEKVAVIESRVPMNREDYR